MTTHFLRGNGQKPAGQYPTGQSPLLNLAGWIKAHFFEYIGLKVFYKTVNPDQTAPSG